MTFGQLATIFLRQWRVFTAVLVLAIGAAVVVSIVLPKEYEANATLSVGDSQANANPQAVDELTQSYLQLLRSPTLARRVSRKLRASTGNAPYEAHFSIPAGTNLLRITATAGNPADAVTVARAYTGVFIRDRRIDELRREIAGLTRQLDRAVGARSEEARLIQAHLALARRELASVSKNGTDRADTVSTVDLTRPTSPSKPQPKAYIAIGAVVGLLLGAAAALATSSFDQRVTDESELARIFDAPILARLPESSGTDVQQDHPLREAVHFLRANLTLAAGDQEPRVVAVTSAVPEAGKTFVVRALCESTRLSGVPTIAVDCDLRRPRLARSWSIGGPGAAEVLAGTARAQDVLQETPSGVRVLAPGEPVADPATLFENPRIAGLLGELSEADARIVIDTPPVLSASETSKLAALADAVVVIVDARETPKDAVIAARDQLAKAGARVLGLVINRTPRQGPYSRYGYHEPFPASSARRDPAVAHTAQTERPKLAEG